MAMGWKEGSVSGYSDGREVLPGVGQMTINILADDWLLMSAGHIVPLDSCNREEHYRGGRGGAGPP